MTRIKYFPRNWEEEEEEDYQLAESDTELLPR